MTKRFLPTKEQCDLIVASNPSFIYKQEFIDGQEAAIYDYRLASYTDFLSPVPDQPEIEGFELRGLTFLKQSDGAWKRYLSMHKFFNVGEVWSINDLKEMKLTGVHTKEDGSLIRFIRTEKGNVFAKTKKTFFSEQAEMANKMPERMLTQGMNLDECRLYELCSPENRIVVHYDKTKLKQLWTRSENGEYGYSIPLLSGYQSAPLPTLEDLLSQSENMTGMEGWVLTFDPGDGSQLFLKLKTPWYLNLHRMISNVNSDKQIIEATLNDRIDDMMQVIQDIPGLADAVRAKQKKVLSYYYGVMEFIRSSLSKYSNFADRKSFYAAHNDARCISVLMHFASRKDKGIPICDNEIDEAVKIWIIKTFSRENDCKMLMNNNTGDII